LDDDYITKMEDVLEIYERPYDPPQPVVCPGGSHLGTGIPGSEDHPLVLDNLNIHRRRALADVFGAEMAAEVWDRFTVPHTPTHGSWLNQAAIEIGMFSRQCLGKRRIHTILPAFVSRPYI
jgi:hypothetical protein